MSAWLRLRVDARREEARPVPVRFGLHGDEHEVEAVLDHWPGAGHHYVKVRTRAGDLYILRHDEERDAWEVAFFRAEGIPPAPPGPGRDA